MVIHIVLLKVRKKNFYNIIEETGYILVLGYTLCPFHYTFFVGVVTFFVGVVTFLVGVCTVISLRIDLARHHI